MSDCSECVNRRTVLKTVAAGSVLGGVGTQNVGAESQQYTLSQNGSEYTLEPLSYNGQSVESFYSYGYPNNASANTPTDLERENTTQLFLYEGPRGISIVLISDKPNTRSGGSVSFDLSGFPTEGSFVVKDDSGEQYSNNLISHNWVDCCTDGFAFRGGLDEQFSITITPDIDFGIDSIVALSGDAGEPEVIQLEEAPITIKTGGQTAPTGFAQARSNKLALADEVTALSPTIDDRVRAEAVLSELQQQLDSGSISTDTAVDAANRLQYGENITETTLAGLGPGVIESPEDPETLIGAALNSPVTKDKVDIVGTTTFTSIEFAVSLTVFGFYVSRIANVLGSLGSRISEAIETIDDLKTISLGLLPSAIDLSGVISNLRDALQEKIGGEQITDGAALYNILNARTAEVVDDVSEDVLGFFENTAPRNISSKLDDLGEAAGGDGDIDFGGTVSGAEQASTESIESIQTLIGERREAFELFDRASLLADILALAGTAAASFTAFLGAGVAFIGAFLSLSFQFLKTAAATDALFKINVRHANGIDAVIDGGY